MLKKTMIQGKILIEYLDGTKEEQIFDDFVVAMNEQRKMMKNKKIMKDIKVLQIIPV